MSKSYDMTITDCLSPYWLISSSIESNQDLSDNDNDKYLPLKNTNQLLVQLLGFITKNFIMVHQNFLSWQRLFVFQVFGYFLSKKKQIKMCRTMITINNLPSKTLINDSISNEPLLYFAVVVSIK